MPLERADSNTAYSTLEHAQIQCGVGRGGAERGQNRGPKNIEWSLLYIASKSILLTLYGV